MNCINTLNDLNYFAVIVCTLISMALGALWYSPLLLGKAWMSQMNFKQEDIEKSSATKGMIVSTITSLIEVIVLALIIKRIGAEDRCLP